MKLRKIARYALSSIALILFMLIWLFPIDSYAYSYGGKGAISAGGSAYTTQSTSWALDTYSFTPTTTGYYTFYSANKSAGDPYFYLIPSSPSSYYSYAVNGLTSAGCRNDTTKAYCLAYDDDTNGDLNFSTTYWCTAGTTYYCFLTGYNTNLTTYYFYVSGVNYSYASLNKQSGSGGTSYYYGGTANYINSAGTRNTSTTYWLSSASTSTTSSITIPTRTGYTFGGYYTSTGGAGTQYINSAGTILGKYSGTLYAYWIKNTNYIYYNYDGGTAGTYNPASASYDTAFYVSAPTRTGYTFAGWSVSGGLNVSTAMSGTSSAPTTAVTTNSQLSANGPSGNVYFMNLNPTNGAAVTLKANWTLNTYYISYNYNGGTKGTYNTSAVNYGYTARVSAPTRTGYTFAGWTVSNLTTSTALYGTSTSPGTAISSATQKCVSGTSDLYFMNLTTTQVATVTLTANWTANLCAVAYDYNGGTAGTTNPSVATYDSAFYVSAPKKAGYIFAGWSVANGLNVSTAVSGTTGTPTTQITSSSHLSLNGATGNTYFKNINPIGTTVVLKANWTAITYNVTYALDGGTAGTYPGANTVPYDSSVYVSVPTKKGYTFAGWTVTGLNTATALYGTTSTPTTPITSSTQKCIGASILYFKNLTETSGGAVTLTANWTPNIYNITYNYASGTKGTTSPATASYDSTFYVSAPTRPGYNFTGWTVTTGLDVVTASYGTTSANLAITSSALKCVNGTSGNVYFKNLITTSGGAVTLTANWSIASYTITLNPQSGSGGVASTTATFGSSMPTVTVPSRTGYIFGGYFTETNGAGTQYYTAAGAAYRSCDLTAATTLYAKWTAINYTIAYDYAGGSKGDIAPATATFDTAFYVAAPKRTGYTFTGWTVTGGLNAATAKYGSSASPATAISDATTMCTNTLNVAAGDVYFKNLSITNSGTVTLTANWKALTSVVTLNPDTGNPGSTSVTATYGSGMPKATMPTKQYYTFHGYYTQLDGGGTQYYNADGSSTRAWNIVGNTTLYAYWTINAYDLTLNNSGVANTKVMMIYGELLPSTVEIPVKVGYEFRGYYEKANGQGISYYDADGQRTYGSKWQTDAALTVYAYWIKGKNQVTVDPKGGSWTDTDKTVYTQAHTFEQYGNSKKTIPNPTKDGYLFVRWEIVAGDGGKIEGNTYTFDIGSAVTLEAKWGPIPKTSFEKVTEANVESKDNKAADLKEIFEDFAEEDNKGVTQEDVLNSKDLELNLTVTDITNTALGAADIKKTAQGEVVKYYDITVTKLLTGFDDVVKEVSLVEIKKAIQIIIPIEGELVGKTGYAVYRYHDGVAERLSVDTKAEEYYTVSEDNTQIIIFTRKFSTYGVVINEISIEDTRAKYNSGDVDILGKIRQGADAVYKIDITWGAMVFDFETGRQWDAQKHAYDGEKVDVWRAEGYENGNNEIIIANHSNADVYVDFNTSSLIEGVDLSVKEENVEDAADAENLLIEKVPTEGAAAPEKSVFLRLLGVPLINVESQIDEVKRLKDLGRYSKAGVITITVRPNTEKIGRAHV